MLGTWLSASPSVLPKRSIVHVRMSLLIFVVILYLIFRRLTGASQTGSTSPTTSYVISTSDHFVALSQAMKDGSIAAQGAPSSIPSSATRFLILPPEGPMQTCLPMRDSKRSLRILRTSLS